MVQLVGRDQERDLPQVPKDLRQDTLGKTGGSEGCFSGSRDAKVQIPEGGQVLTAVSR